MCFAAIHWARINTIVFGASIDDADDAGFNELKISNETLVKIGDPSVTLIKGVCREECVALFGLWLQMGGHRSY